MSWRFNLRRYSYCIRKRAISRSVDLAWLTKRFPLSRHTLLEKLELFNLGGEGKKLYDPNVVIPFLKTDFKSRRGRPRKN